jgi:hypothetical protein
MLPYAYTKFGRWWDDATTFCFNYLIVLWTLSAANGISRPPRWMRILIAVTFPISYPIIAAAFIATVIIFFVVEVVAWIVYTIFGRMIVGIFVRAWEK